MTIAGPAVVAARDALLESVGSEVAAFFAGMTRLGGQIVAVLYLAGEPRSMDELVTELGRSKSNIFANLRALEAAAIVERRREMGRRHDSFTLRGTYPDMVIGAYLRALGRLVHDKRAHTDRARDALRDVAGREASAVRDRVDDLSRRYELYAALLESLPPFDAATDLEALVATLKRSRR
jgi:DNA-binding transcriptional regulator GbsR (MarR family)